jgi:hypothetical protein
LREERGAHREGGVAAGVGFGGVEVVAVSVDLAQFGVQRVGSVEGFVGVEAVAGGLKEGSGEAEGEDQRALGREREVVGFSESVGGVGDAPLGGGRGRGGGVEVGG